MAAITELTFKPDTITDYGITDAVPNSRTLTINSVTYDLSADRTWTISGTGLTSVGLSAPTGFDVANSPLTANGTIALSFSSGYSLPTTIKQSNWDDAYTFVTAFPSQTGNSGKYLTTNGSVLSWGTVSGGVTDGDKGDITVSGSGATWTIDNGVIGIAKLSATGTPSATTYLRGDNTWATISGGGTPAGTTGQVQYNNAGAFGGAANVKIVNGDLTLVDAAFPSTPATGETAIFMDTMAGRHLVGSVGDDGTHFDFQPALFNSTSFMWVAGTGTTLAINWGTSFTARNNGTGAAQATPTRASTNAITSLNRATFSTGTTATGASGIQSASTVAWLGNAANLGGFFFFARFGLEAISGTYRCFIGISANNATMAADSSTWNNTIGFGKDAADTTWQFILRNNGTVTTKATTAISFNSTDIYDLYIYAKPNSTVVDWEVRNALTNAVLDTNTEGANLPLNTTFMYMQTHIQSTVGTTPKLLALNRMYLESTL